MSHIETAMQKFKRRANDIQADAKTTMHADIYKAAAFQVLAEEMAVDLDAERRRHQADMLPPEPFSKDSLRVKIKLEGETLTVDGYYHKGEEASIDSAGSDAEFEVDGIFCGPTDLGMLLESRIDEIAGLALKAYESGASEASAAAQFDAQQRRAA